MNADVVGLSFPLEHTCPACGRKTLFEAGCGDCTERGRVPESETSLVQEN